MMSSAEEESTKRSTCIHNKLNTFAKGSQKATSMPLGLEIKGRRQARLKLAESNLDRVSCTDLSGTAVCETDAWSVFKANLPSRLHCPPFSCTHYHCIAEWVWVSRAVLWMTQAIEECLQLCIKCCQGSMTHADCEKQTKHPQSWSGFLLSLVEALAKKS